VNRILITGGATYVGDQRFCALRLEPFKIRRKTQFVQFGLYGDRLKMRAGHEVTV
jgi:hypothetical protein